MIMVVVFDVRKRINAWHFHYDLFLKMVIVNREGKNDHDNSSIIYKNVSTVSRAFIVKVEM